MPKEITIRLPMDWGGTLVMSAVPADMLGWTVETTLDITGPAAVLPGPLRSARWLPGILMPSLLRMVLEPGWVDDDVLRYFADAVVTPFP